MNKWQYDKRAREIQEWLTGRAPLIDWWVCSYDERLQDWDVPELDMDFCIIAEITAQGQKLRASVSLEAYYIEQGNDILEWVLHETAHKLTWLLIGKT